MKRKRQTKGAQTARQERAAIIKWLLTVAANIKESRASAGLSPHNCRADAFRDAAKLIEVGMHHIRKANDET